MYPKSLATRAMKCLFTEHPASVGETWFQHLCSAWYFAGQMFLGCLACLLHGLVPSLFEKTGSGRITHLHDRMVLNRSRLPRSEPDPAEDFTHGLQGKAS